MEVLKDYPKEFAKLFRPSFNFLANANMKFFLKNEGFMRKYWRFLYIIPCLVINYVTLGFNVAKTVAQGQIFEIAILLPLFLISTQGILKFMLLFPKMPLLTTVIQELGDLWRTTGLNDVQKIAREGLLKKLNFCNGFTYTVGIIGTSQYLITPLLETILRRFIWKQDCELMLAVNCSYPFYTSDWYTYGAVYMFQVYSIFLCVFIYTGAELLMITLCALLGMEFTLLCEDMPNVKVERKTKNHQANTPTENDNPKEGIITLNAFVKRHQKLCGLSTQLNEAFNQMIFVNLMFVGLTTCFFRYAAQFSRGPTYMINNYTAVCSSLIYVLYLCYYGEMLTGASLRIGDMAYNSIWYKGDKHYQKAIFIIIKRSQKACCLTSMNYAPVTLNMFTKVMSTTWSYLSLMNSVYEEENQ